MKTLQINTTIEVSTAASELRVFFDRIKAITNSCLIVTGGQRTKSTALYRAAIDGMHHAELQFDIYDSVTSNPLAEHVVAGALKLRSMSAGAVLTIGGGSVHDTGKLMAVMSNQDLDINDIVVENEGYKKISSKITPVFCLPLLAGTGAEISPASLIRLDNQKRIVFSPHMFPIAAHYSIPLMFTGDQRLNVLTAFDALIQSIEAYLSNSACHWSDMFARDGIRSAIRGLREFSINPSSISAREYVVYSAIQGLLAVANSSVGAIHALSDPLSGRYNIHHGTALALVAPEVLKLNYFGREERFDDIANLFAGCSDEPISGRALPNILANFIDQVCPDWKAGIPAFNVSQKQLDDLVEESINPDMAGNPRTLSHNEIGGVFMAALS